MLQGRQERWPKLRTTCLHSRVQGQDAWRDIVAALDRVALLRPPVDLVVCARGGGGTAELSEVFDNEQVVRAILRVPVPVICAVGHECDRHLAEEAADYRAKTPSSAVDLGIPRKSELVQRLHGAARTLHAAAVQRAVNTRAALLPLEQKLLHDASAVSARSRAHLRLLQQSFQSAVLAGSKCIGVGATRLETALRLQIVATRAKATTRLTLLRGGVEQDARALAGLIEDHRSDTSRLSLAAERASAHRRAGFEASVLALRSALQTAAHRAVLRLRGPHEKLLLQLQSRATLSVAQQHLRQLRWQAKERNCGSLCLSRSTLEKCREDLQTKSCDGRRSHTAALATLRGDLFRARSPRKRTWPQVFLAESAAQALRSARTCAVGQSICIRLPDGEIVAAVRRIKLQHQ
jgi:exodeoxyribonuclease VII large subunit